MLPRKATRFTTHRKAAESHAAAHDPFPQLQRSHLPGHQRRGKPVGQLRRNWDPAMPPPPSPTGSCREALS